MSTKAKSINEEAQKAIKRAFPEARSVEERYRCNMSELDNISIWNISNLMELYQLRILIKRSGTGLVVHFSAPKS